MQEKSRNCDMILQARLMNHRRHLLTRRLNLRLSHLMMGPNPIQVWMDQMMTVVKTKSAKATVMVGISVVEGLPRLQSPPSSLFLLRSMMDRRMCERITVL